MIPALILALLWQPAAPATLHGTVVSIDPACGARAIAPGVPVALADFAGADVGFTITWVDPQSGELVPRCEWVW